MTEFRTGQVTEYLEHDGHTQKCSAAGRIERRRDLYKVSADDIDTSQKPRDKQGVEPELVIREGEPYKEIMAQIQDDPEVGVLVLGANTDKKGPGPLVTQISKSAGDLSVPVTIVPGDLSKERLEAIT